MLVVGRLFTAIPGRLAMISGSLRETFHLSLLSIAFAVAGCSALSTTSDAQQKQTVARILETYAQAMKTGEYDKVHFAPDITFLGPLTNGVIVGEEQVMRFLAKVSEGVKDVRVKRRVIDGDFACVIADLETKDGHVVPFCEFFRVVDGRIAEIRPYFDPRPLIR
jgi:limonene-1,2-epoxide hydrolase